jgi:hypothetical protein
MMPDLYLLPNNSPLILGAGFSLAICLILIHLPNPSPGAFNNQMSKYLIASVSNETYHVTFRIIQPP